MNNIRKYLPIGSVVMLKNGEKKVMIIGYGVVSSVEENKIYDYSAVLFPEGILNNNECFMFNHEDISNLYYLGYSSEEYTNYNNKLNSFLLNKSNI